MPYSTGTKVHISIAAARTSISVRSSKMAENERILQDSSYIANQRRYTLPAFPRNKACLCRLMINRRRLCVLMLSHMRL